MFLIKVTERGATPKLTAKQHRHHTRDMLNNAGVKWHRDYRPKHFTKAGAREYGYEPRGGEQRSGSPFKGSYTAKKLRLFGHTRPLVFTGESEARTRVRDIRANSKRVRVVMNAPALNFRPTPQSPDLRDEMTRVSPAEQDEIVRESEKYLARTYARMSDSETTTITAV